jgi:hypothetical protein
MQGLDSNKTPFKYLDDFVIGPDWQKLHADVCWGISQSHWNKRFVSSGVHPDYAGKEITPYMRDFQHNLDEYSVQKFEALKTTDEKIKFLTAWGPVPHPFWLVYLRNNVRRERTGIFNKSVSADCVWTDNSNYFSSLIEFINTLPFAEIGRVILFMTEANNPTLPHYDAAVRHERPHDDFIWFTTKPMTKKMYVLDEETNIRHYADDNRRFIWFNEMDYHGTEAVDHFSFSVRIDGKFDSTVRSNLCQ